METTRQLLHCLNLARQKPTYYLALVEKQLSEFENDMEIILAPQVLYETNEGKKAWVQAKEFLRRQSSLPALIKNTGLSLAAEDHANDMSKSNIFGHIGSDKSTFSERVQRYCKKGTGCMVQIIGADFLLQNRKIGEMTVLGLIIDDGVKDRGHRNAIFNPQYKYVGVGVGTQNEKALTVFTLSQSNLQLKAQKEWLKENLQNRVLRSSLTNQDKQNHIKITYGQNIRESKNQKQNKSSELKKPINSPSQEVKIKLPDYGKKNEQKLIPYGSNSKISNGIRQLPTLTNITKEKKMLEKKEITKTIYQNGYKISQLKTIIKYTDGSIEENTERVTNYVE